MILILSVTSYDNKTMWHNETILYILPYPPYPVKSTGSTTTLKALLPSLCLCASVVIFRNLEINQYNPIYMTFDYIRGSYGREMGNSVKFREARIGDLHKLVLLLEDDPRGKMREDSTDLTPYEKAFRTIESNPNHHILIAEVDNEVVGCVQISFLPNLSFKGSWRAELEGVRIRSDCRGKGVGKQMIQEAIAHAKARGCHLIQLTSSKSREDAIAFYKQLGFQDSHVGMKKNMLDTEK